MTQSVTERLFTVDTKVSAVLYDTKFIYVFIFIEKNIYLYRMYK